jgi:site-specific DNA recombinase
MVGESGTSHTMKAHHYYKCVSAKNKKGCDKKTVKKDWIEDLVVEQTMKMVFNDTLIEAIADSVINLLDQDSNALPLLQQQLSETNRGIQNLLNAIQQGILTPSTKQRLDELEAAKSDLEVRILQEEMVKPTLTKEQLIFWLTRFRKLDVTQEDQRQRLIDTFVNAIYLYDDKIVFIFNYKDGSKTITFNEVNGLDLESSGAPIYLSNTVINLEWIYGSILL